MKMSAKSFNDELMLQYTGLTKQDLLLESAIFNERVINTKKCQQVLTKLIYLFDKGQEFTDDELSGLFFSITKLFQSDDPNLKRILFVALKYMKNTSVFCMVTNCINKDISSTNENIKANALRLLSLIVESQNPLQLERTLKNCLVNKNPLIIEGALVACCEIIQIMPDVVKKCTDEVTHVLGNNKDSNIQFKAFLLVQTLKQGDVVSFTKIISNFIINQSQYGELCTVYMIRAIAELLNAGGENSNNSIDKKTYNLFLTFLKDSIQNEQKSVVLEAARVMINLPGIENKQLKPVVERLKEFLNENEDVYKYSVLRIFNALLKNSLRFSLFQNFEQIRTLLESKNKNIVSLAISILAKIATPEDLEKLLDQIFELLEDLPLFVKIEVVESSLIAIKKNIRTADSVVKFLTRSLKEKGNIEFRILVVRAMTTVSEVSEEFCVKILEYMAEYIEDSQNREITLAMLQSIGKLMIRVPNPQGYFKYLINRLTLDSPSVVVATVSCLGQIAQKRKSLGDDILMILEPFRNAAQYDEIRAISDFYINQIQKLKSEAAKMNELKIEDCNFIIEPDQVDDILNNLENSMKQDIFDTSFINFTRLKENTKSAKDVVSYFTKQDEPQQTSEAKHRPKIGKKDDSRAALLNYKPMKSKELIQAETALKSRPEFEFLGDLLILSDFINLSEPGSEIFVKLRKNIFKDYIALEFVLLNNSDNQISQIHMEIEYECDALHKNRIIGPDVLMPGQTDKLFLILKKGPEYIANAEFQVKFYFMASVFEGEELVNVYSDEFGLENFEIKTNDFVSKYPFEISIAEFNYLSEEFGPAKPQTQNYKLDFKTIDLAISELLKIFGMNPCGQSNIVDANKNYHTLYMIGRYLDKFPILVHCQIGINTSRKCMISINVKAENEEMALAFCDL